MRLHKALLSGFIIAFTGTQALYAAECPGLTLNDFIQGTINVSVNLEIQNSIPAYDDSRYDGSSCDGYESPIPASTCLWQDR